MGFLRSTKGSIISDYFQLQEDIAGFSKGYMYDVALYDDHLEITSMQKRKLLLMIRLQMCSMVERLNLFKNQSL